MTADRTHPPAQAQEGAVTISGRQFRLVGKKPDQHVEEWINGEWSFPAALHIGTTIDHIAALTARNAELEGELRTIDASLARRPALDQPTRAGKIERACSENQRMSDRLAQLERERDEYDALSKDARRWLTEHGEWPLGDRTLMRLITRIADGRWLAPARTQGEER